MKADIGISEKNTKAVADKLQVILADEYVLYTKTRNYHWNVEAPNFMELHKLFESQYEEIDEMIDDIAERIRSIGHYSTGRLQDFLSLTNLLEPNSNNKAEKQIKNLLQDHETLIKELRKCEGDFSDKFKDAGSADFVTALMEKHEKMAWMLRSYLS
ncbi:MAG TPA: DNA starvation/stationary phase protection protein [Ignavibacteria bacterium]|nr:DNA starvation/stationary phase protection protein [Ignavibacteria bacterium]